jgi:electron transfer flavoprotein-quinone oxidoreductase
MVCDLVESLFTVTNPTPKPGGGRTALRALRAHGVRARDLAVDAWRGARSYG